MPEAGGNITALPSAESASPSGSSSGSSSPSGSLTAKSLNVLAWGTFGVIGYAWLFTSKLDSRPAWEPMVALVANALPGGMLADIAKTVGLALVDKLPGRSAGK